MGYYLSKIYKQIFGKKYFQILLLGLDGSGKSTILSTLNNNESLKILPSIGIHIETIVYKDILNIISWDLGGASRMRELFKIFYPDTDGLIIVVDSADKERLDYEGKDFFDFLLEEEELKNCPLLIMANKKDMKDTLSLKEISERFEMENYDNRKWCIKGVSGKTNEGLEESLLWIISSIKEQKEISK